MQELEAEYLRKFMTNILSLKITTCTIQAVVLIAEFSTVQINRATQRTEI